MPLFLWGTSLCSNLFLNFPGIGLSSSVEELNLSNFITNNVTIMSSMFSCYISLNELNLSNFNTNNIINKNVLGLPDKSAKKIKNL